MAKDRFKKLTDLFVRGRHLRLPDGQYLWIQALNSFERDDCVSAAQVARARMVMALKVKGEEREKVLGHIAEVGVQTVIAELCDQHAEENLFRMANQIRDDPDWEERMRIIDETEISSESAKTMTEDELQLLDKLQNEFLTELGRRRDEDAELYKLELSSMDDEEIETKYLDAWLDKRGAASGSTEYSLNEVVFSTYYSEPTLGEDGDPDLTKGTGRGERVFADTLEVRSAPQELVDLIRGSISLLNMSERDPKDSGSHPASSGSSPTPSEPVEPTPSTSTGTQPAPRGTSSQLSPTP